MYGFDLVLKFLTYITYSFLPLQHAVTLNAMPMKNCLRREAQRPKGHFVKFR